MKLLVGYCLVFCLFLTACGTGNHTSRKKFSGIDYTSYTQPNTQSFVPTTQEDYIGVLPQPSVLDEEVDPLTSPAQEQTEEPALSEEEDFTSEEIAASYGRYTDVTVVAAAKRIKLGSSANSKNMALFQEALDAAYKKALRTYRPAGFTYSIASVGAVNPLSDIEVSCILGEQAANEQGQVTCNLFFQTLVQQYNILLKEAQKNAAL